MKDKIYIVTHTIAPNSPDEWTTNIIAFKSKKQALCYLENKKRKASRQHESYDIEEIKLIGEE